MERGLSIEARWSGPIEAEDGEGIHGLVIRDDAAYDRLCARLPAQQVQQQQPAPPSADPLRARPPIDFAAEMLVVVIRSGSMAPLAIARVAEAAGSVIIQFAAAPVPPEARPFGVGMYAAARVARAEGAIELRGPRVIEDAGALEGAVGELVTLRGALSRTRMATILGVDVDHGSAAGDAPAEATGWLERDEVTRAALDEQIARDGQFANRGAGVFYRLVAPDGEGLAPARRRWLAS